MCENVCVILCVIITLLLFVRLFKPPHYGPPPSVRLGIFAGLVEGDLLAVEVSPIAWMSLVRTQSAIGVSVAAQEGFGVAVVGVGVMAVS